MMGFFAMDFWHGGESTASALTVAFERLGENSQEKKSSAWLDKSWGDVNMRAGTGAIEKREDEAKRFCVDGHEMIPFLCTIRYTVLHVNPQSDTLILASIPHLSCTKVRYVILPFISGQRGLESSSH